MRSKGWGSVAKSLSGTSTVLAETRGHTWVSEACSSAMNPRLMAAGKEGEGEHRQINHTWARQRGAALHRPPTHV